MLISIKRQEFAWPLILFFLILNVYSPIITKASTALFVCYLVLLNIADLKITLKCAFKAWPLLLFILWEIFSVFFSAIPKISFNIILNDFAIYCLTLLLAQYCYKKNIIASLKLLAIILISLSIIYSILFIHSSIHADGMKAFYGQKNLFGLVMAICTIILTFSPEKRIIDYAFAVLGFVLLILSQSKTSLNVTMIIITIWSLIIFIRWQFGKISEYSQGFIKLASKTIPPTLQVLIILMVIFSNEIANFLIQNIPDEAFTGRGELWTTVLSRTRNDLVTGIGLGVFWGADRASEIAKTLLYEQDWIQELRAADGGYIDMIGALGFVGLGLLFSSYVYVYKIILNNISHKIVPLAFAFVTFFVFHDIFETDMFKFINIPWFLFLLMAFYLTLLGMPESKSLQVKTKKTTFETNHEKA